MNVFSHSPEHPGNLLKTSSVCLFIAVSLQNIVCELLLGKMSAAKQCEETSPDTGSQNPRTDTTCDSAAGGIGSEYLTLGVHGIDSSFVGICILMNDKNGVAG